MFCWLHKIIWWYSIKKPAFSNKPTLLKHPSFWIFLLRRHLATKPLFIQFIINWFWIHNLLRPISTQQNFLIGQKFLYMCENVALNLNGMLRLTNVLLCQMQSAQKILLSGNQPIMFKNVLSYCREHNTKINLQENVTRINFNNRCVIHLTFFLVYFTTLAVCITHFLNQKP